VLAGGAGAAEVLAGGGAAEVAGLVADCCPHPANKKEPKSTTVSKR
jgi:hypothetical protein